MKKLLKDSKKKIGQAPGSLIYVGEKKPQDVKLTVTVYNQDAYDEVVIDSFDQLPKLMQPGKMIWINSDGLKPDLVGKIGSYFNIHPLTLEDVLNTNHRPKTEDHGRYIFVVVKMLGYNHGEENVKVEHLSIIVGRDFVLTFQEDRIDEFEIIRENIRQNKGRIRELNTDYLAYRILDLIIDNYFSVIENFGDRIEDIEDELLEKPTEATLQKLYKLKGDMILIRRAIWPLRETISSLEKLETDIIARSSRPYLRDLYDHVIQIIDTTENYREMVAGMMDIYLSSVSNRLNEIMKVLTIISTIFIPLNFIAGIYGMNFNTSVSRFNMPELNWVLGYPFVLTLMLIVAVLLLYFFSRKKWL